MTRPGALRERHLDHRHGTRFAVRDGELIPWDWDADFGIAVRDAEAVLTLREEMEAAGHHAYLGDPASIRLYSIPIRPGRTSQTRR